MDPAVGRVANATAQHIRLALTAGFHKPGGIDEDDDKETGIEIMSTPLDDGTNDILAVSRPKRSGRVLIRVGRRQSM